VSQYIIFDNDLLYKAALYVNNLWKTGITIKASNDEKVCVVYDSE
jgi:hypothetical protein